MELVTVNQRISFLRRQKGVDISEVSKATGITDDSLYAYERELSPAMPRLNKIKKLADYYGVSVNYLLEGKEAPQIVSNVSKTDSLLEELIRKIDKFSDNQQDVYRIIVDVLLKERSKSKGPLFRDNVISITGQRQSESEQKVVGWD